MNLEVQAYPTLARNKIADDNVRSFHIELTVAKHSIARTRAMG